MAVYVFFHKIMAELIMEALYCFNLYNILNNLTQFARSRAWYDRYFDKNEQIRNVFNYGKFINNILSQKEWRNLISNAINRNPNAYKPRVVPAAWKVISGFKEEEEMEMAAVSDNRVHLITLEEKKYIGAAVTAAFQNVAGIGEARERFMGSLDEIQNKTESEEYVGLHFANDVVFTYIYGLEVSELSTIPPGMMGFTVPSCRYATVRSQEADPYAVLQAYLRENGLESHPGLFSMEVFRFGEEESKYRADIRIPIQG